MNPANIAPNMFRARQAKGRTQKSLAEAIGVTTMAVCQWETGRRVPSVARLVQISDALECTPNDLLTGPEGDPGLLINALAE